MRRTRPTVSTNYDGAAKFYESLNEIDKKKHDISTSRCELKDCSCLDNSKDRKLTPEPSDLNKNLDLSNSLDGTIEDGDKTIIENSNSRLESKSFEPSPTKSLKPPPLPPKPKGLLTNIVKPSEILSVKPIPRSTHITSESRENKNIF